MQIFMQQLINGLSLSSIYALLALGYTMIYGIVKIIHFAHGDVYMLGAFFGYYTINVWHFNFIMALFGSMIFCALVGMLIEFVAYRPLRHSSRIAVLITAIGVSYFLENGMSVLFSGDTRDFPQVIKQVNYEWFGIRVTNIQLLIFATTIILMIILQLIVKKTKMGRAMRAAAADPVAAELMGININGTISFVFAIGSAMAGAAGVLIGLYYNSIEPTMGLTPGSQSLCRRSRWRCRLHSRGGSRGRDYWLSGITDAGDWLLSFQGCSRLCCFNYRIAVLASRSVWQQAARKGLGRREDENTLADHCHLVRLHGSRIRHYLCW